MRSLPGVSNGRLENKRKGSPAMVSAALERGFIGGWGLEAGAWSLVAGRRVLVLFDSDEVSYLVEFAVADAGYEGHLFNGRKWTVGLAEGYDLLCGHRANTGQLFQLLLAGHVNVDQCARGRDLDSISSHDRSRFGLAPGGHVDAQAIRQRLSQIDEILVGRLRKATGRFYGVLYDSAGRQFDHVRPHDLSADVHPQQARGRGGKQGGRWRGRGYVDRGGTRPIDHTDGKSTQGDAKKEDNRKNSSDISIEQQSAFNYGDGDDAGHLLGDAGPVDDVDYPVDILVSDGRFFGQSRHASRAHVDAGRFELIT